MGVGGADMTSKIFTLISAVAPESLLKSTITATAIGENRCVNCVETPTLTQQNTTVESL